MNKRYNNKLVKNSQELRINMTKEERHLWYDFLNKLPITFNRQKVIGNYIVDFYCASKKLVLELDGSQHYMSEGRKNDLERDAYFNELGIKVLRFSNLDVNKNFNGVCREINRYIT
ncbi:MAG: endonuclease domain-containing protein [Clostridia bacterium]|nr:endonuclease domain-containing protein [Clostridia bacterium]